MRIGVIGGTGLYRFLDTAATSPVTVESAYGPVRVLAGQHEGHDVFFLNRHGDEHTVAPHRIDPRRHLDALARCGAQVVFAVNNTGALRETLRPASYVVPHDLVDLTGRHATFFDDDVVHIDYATPYCPAVRQALVQGARAQGVTAAEEAVYVGVRGPRFETPAEVRWLRTLGDVVGMTGCPEAALARERGLCYASLCFVANGTDAEGTGPSLEATAVREALQAQGGPIGAILQTALQHVPAERTCTCRAAPERGRLMQPSP